MTAGDAETGIGKYFESLINPIAAIGHGLQAMGFGSEAIGQRAGLTGDTGISQAEQDRLDLQERQTVALESIDVSVKPGSYN